MMTYRFSDPEGSAIIIDYEDGRQETIPEGHRLYERLVGGYAGEDGEQVPRVEVEPYTPPAATAEDVKGEASRRILARHPVWRQLNALSRMIRLIRKGASNWTQGERNEATAIEAALGWINDVRQASNDLEPAPPADYRDDAYWPG